MANEVTKLIMETILGLITTAFAFVAGLAWNDAIQALIATFLDAGSALTGLIAYAVIVTILAVVVSLLLGRFADKAGVEIE